MQAFGSLLAEHRAMQPLLAQFKVVLMQPPCAAAQVTAVRRPLLRALLDHLDHEDRYVCGCLAVSGNAQAVAASARFGAEFGALRASVRRYAGEWPAERATGEWDGFCDASCALLRDIEARVVEEEARLYPEAARLLKQVPDI